MNFKIEEKGILKQDEEKEVDIEAYENNEEEKEKKRTWCGMMKDNPNEGAICSRNATVVFPSPRGGCYLCPRTLLESWPLSVKPTRLFTQAV